VRAQWLHRDRPADLLRLVRQIALLPIEPTAAIAPSADLVAWSRLGARTTGLISTVRCGTGS
jgi:hypothetical protein